KDRYTKIRDLFGLNMDLNLKGTKKHLEAIPVSA
ncbi:MAG: hypothetical protein ACI9WS_002324, partial [Paraglaciecola psychrophila]